MGDDKFVRLTEVGETDIVDIDFYWSVWDFDIGIGYWSDAKVFADLFDIVSARIDGNNFF